MSEPNFEAEITNFLIRMVTPIRREFGHSLDVNKFLSDRPYALEVLQQAHASKDDRLRENAFYLEQKMFGPRNSGDNKRVRTADAPPSPEEQGKTRAAPDANPTAHAKKTLSEEELRARMLEKYKSGLR